MSGKADAIQLIGAAFQDTHEHHLGSIELGMVGWEGDDDSNYFDLGADGNDGNTFIHVQLFRGRDPSVPLNPNAAQGAKGVCKLNTLALHRVPKRGTIVHVSIPGGHSFNSGAAVISAAMEYSPATQFSDTKAKLDFGVDVDLVIKARSVTITNYDNAQISLTPEGGVQAFDKDGAGFQINNNKFMCTGEEFSVSNVGGLGTIGTAFIMNGSSIVIAETTGTKLEFSGGSTLLSTSVCTLNYQFGFLGPTPSINPPLDKAMRTAGASNTTVIAG